MKHTLSRLTIALPLGLLLLVSCVTSVDMIEVGSNLAKRSHGPPPESEWNAMGIWQRVGDNPTTYIPNGYPVSAPRSSETGIWMEDKRDGKRLFVPNEKVGEFGAGVLMGEARKVTRWQPLATPETMPGMMIFP